MVSDINFAQNHLDYSDNSITFGRSNCCGFTFIGELYHLRCLLVLGHQDRSVHLIYWGCFTTAGSIDAVAFGYFGGLHKVRCQIVFGPLHRRCLSSLHLSSLILCLVRLIQMSSTLDYWSSATALIIHWSNHWCHLSLKLPGFTKYGFITIDHTRLLHYQHPHHYLLCNLLYLLYCLLGWHHSNLPDNGLIIANNFDPVGLSRSCSHKDCWWNPLVTHRRNFRGFPDALHPQNYFQVEHLLKVVHRVLDPSFRRYLA